MCFSSLVSVTLCSAGKAKHQFCFCIIPFSFTELTVTVFSNYAQGQKLFFSEKCSRFSFMSTSIGSPIFFLKGVTKSVYDIVVENDRVIQQTSFVILQKCVPLCVKLLVLIGVSSQTERNSSSNLQWLLQQRCLNQQVYHLILCLRVFCFGRCDQQKIQYALVKESTIRFNECKQGIISEIFERTTDLNVQVCLFSLSYTTEC